VFYCRNCGAELPGNPRVCSHCGTDQDQPVSIPQDQRIPTENVSVPPPGGPQQQSAGSWVGRGFGGGLGASIGLILGACLVVTLLFVLSLVSCAAILAAGSHS
jgi:hypothetical protein